MKKQEIVGVLLVVAVILTVTSVTADVASPRYLESSVTISSPLPLPELKALVASANYHRCGTRRCFDANGTAYIVARVSATVRVYKETGVDTFTEQDGGDRPSAAYIYDVDARFNGTLIHIVYYQDVGAKSPFNIMYVTFNTSDDQWGTPELVEQPLDVPLATYCRCAISLDSSDKPHVVYTVCVRIKGTDYTHVRYKNKTGVSWSTEEIIHPATDETHRIDMTVGHESDDRFVAVWKNITDADVGVRTRSSAGAWDTEGVVKASSIGPSLTIDPSDRPQVALATGQNLYCVEGTSGANPSWTNSAILETTARDPSIATGGFGGCHLYIVYEEWAGGDVMVVVKNGAWSEPVELQDSGFPGSGVIFYHVVAQDPSSPDDFDYSWCDSGGNIHWDEYVFEVPKMTAGIAPGGMVF